MKAVRLRIHNVLGIEDLDIELGQITRIEGPNGSGKTSIIEALKSLFAGGTDVTLLRNGADSGEAGLMVDEGIEITRRVTPNGSTLSIKHPEFGKVSKPQSVVETLATIAAVNPVHFLNLPPKKRTEYLLEVCPIEVDPLEIEGILAPTGLAPTFAATSGLDAIDQVRRIVYDSRTAANTTAREKRGTIAQLSASLPAVADMEIDYDAELAACDRALESLGEQMTNERHEIARRKLAATEQAVSVVRAQMDGARDGLKDQLREIDVEIAHLEERLLQKQTERREMQSRIATIGQAEAESLERAAADAAVPFDEELREATARYEKLASETRENRATVAARAIEIERHRNTAEIVEGMRAEAEQWEQKSAALSDAIIRLDELKRSKLASLPIEGIEIRDGEIYCNDVPFDRLNTARRIDIAFELACLRIGKLPLLFIDGAEALDSESLAHLEARAIERDIQLVVARVTDGPLQVVSGEVEA